jgi:hypothetical protein
MKAKESLVVKTNKTEKKILNLETKIDHIRFSKKVMEIKKFLGSLNKLEFMYLEHSMRIVNNINSLIEEFGIPKEVICEKFEINICDYDNFTNGNFEYSSKDFTVINMLHYQYNAEKIKEKAPIKV